MVRHHDEGLLAVPAAGRHHKRGARTAVNINSPQVHACPTSPLPQEPCYHATLNHDRQACSRRTCLLAGLLLTALPVRWHTLPAEDMEASSEFARFQTPKVHGRPRPGPMPCLPRSQPRPPPRPQPRPHAPACPAHRPAHSPAHMLPPAPPCSQAPAGRSLRPLTLRDMLARMGCRLRVRVRLEEECAQQEAECAQQEAECAELQTEVHRRLAAVRMEPTDLLAAVRAAATLPTPEGPPVELLPGILRARQEVLHYCGDEFSAFVDVLPSKPHGNSFLFKLPGVLTGSVAPKTLGLTLAQFPSPDVASLISLGDSSALKRRKSQLHGFGVFASMPQGKGTTWLADVSRCSRAVAAAWAGPHVRQASPPFPPSLADRGGARGHEAVCQAEDLRDHAEGGGRQQRRGSAVLAGWGRHALLTPPHPHLSRVAARSPASETAPASG